LLAPRPTRLEEIFMNERSRTPSDDKIARRNYVLLCAAATILMGLVIAFAVVDLG
jgi:hypothetical protein